MSLITQCPACSTMFRVVPDQLRISEGWVRCGQCDEVFDANAHLRSLEEAPIVMMPLQANNEPAYDWGAVLADSAQATPVAEHEPMALTDDGADAAPELQAQESSNPSVLPTLDDDWAPTVYAGLVADDSEAEQAPVLRSEVPLDDPAPTFMASAKGASAAGHRPAKKTLLAACSLLALSLVAQVLFMERDRIAAASPALRPLLVSGCGYLACTVSAPREIESIAIDSSAFTSVRPGVYLLHATLKNAAAIALATPALEITLTDTQDKPVLRRVVLAGELSDKTSMAAGAELVASLPVSIKPGATPEKIAGYKLLAFYP